MAGVATEESGAGMSTERASKEQQYQAGVALAEWRSSEQVENGNPSTSPPYWDSDDDDGGPKPSDLYGKYTWKIDKFSQINKKELRSNAFEVGGYKWYILIYPQGCDVCNHLSLFLCVANHDKLLPGWSHFAQFTIAVVNKDPKKSKYSDTLHRFWKKEHDWGWKKFMELSKVLDGFIDSDTLIIKAQVQVIRERTDRPFRCLDCQYRRELVRVYLTNVEQICRRFVEERRGKLGKLIEDKARWSSFCAFWVGMDTSSRRRMSREKAESILKVVVKHFFIEKEVTSTLVMDSLYSGLKALEGQYKGKKNKGKHLEAEELPVPIVRMDKDSFVLVDDVLPLLERAAMEPLPPKDEKGPQTRTKDGAPGEEFNKDSIERDERRLTELGRRTIEIFILAHIFSSKIEVAYQEAVALKRQEELIREEEAAWLAEIEHKVRRGAVDKEKKSKKKQGKQKRNNRKGKDKGRDDKPGSNAHATIEQEDTVEREDLVAAEPEMVIEKSDAVEDVSDVSDSVDIIPPDSEDRDVSPVNWDTDTSEVHPPTDASSSGISRLSSVQNGTEGRSSSVVDDSSSTCSSDSVPYVSITGSNSRSLTKNQKSPSRALNHQGKLTSDPADWVNKEPSPSFEALPDAKHSVNGSKAAVESLSQAADGPSQDTAINGIKRHSGKKEEETRAKDVQPSGDKAAPLISPSVCPSKNIPSIAPPKLESKANTSSDPHMVKKLSSVSPRQVDISARLANSTEIAVTSRPDVQKVATPRPTTPAKPSNIASEKPALQHAGPTSDNNKPSIPPTSVTSRPLSAPVIPGPRPAVSAISMVQTAPILARSASTTGRLAPEPAQSSYIPQSYRNAIVGGPVIAHSFPQNHPAPSVANPSIPYSQAPPPHVSAPLFSHSDRMDPIQQNKHHFSFGMVNHHHHHDTLQNGPPQPPLWMESPPLQRDTSRMLDAYSGVHGHQNHHIMGEEFPHLDIINDLLDDEHGIGNLAVSDSGYRSFGNGPQYLNRHFSFPGGEPGVSSGPGPSMGPCRFERTRSYPDEGFQYGYGGPGNSYGGPLLGEFVSPQASPGAYANGHYAPGHIDGLIPNNQWQMGGSDQPFMGVRNADNDGYPYHIADYQNLTVGVNGYTVFRPSNGL